MHSWEISLELDLNKQLLLPERVLGPLSKAGHQTLQVTPKQ